MSNKKTSKKSFSDNEIMSDFTNYSITNKKELKNKIKNIPNPKDFPSSMSEGRLYQKFAIEYIKKILLMNNNCKFSENITFNFFEYVQIFTESDHSTLQKQIFQDLISLKNEKAQSQDYIFFGEFDLVISSIPGLDIMNAMNNFKYNIYQYPGKEIKKEDNYCIIGEIKKDFFEEIKKEEIKKQFNKYAKIFQLLSSKPNLNKLKKKMGIDENNKLLFLVVTDGNYYYFDFMRHIIKKFKEETHSDIDSDKLPYYFKIFDFLNSIVPVLLIFVPRILDDNKGIFSSKYEQKIISDLKKEIKGLRNSQVEMEKKHKKEIEIIKQQMNQKMELMEQNHKKEIKQMEQNHKKDIEQFKQQMDQKMEKSLKKLLGKKNLKNKKVIKNEEESEEEESKELEESSEEDKSKKKNKKQKK